MDADPTTDPALRSWVPVPPRSDFSVQNLPYGVFSRPGQRRRVGVAIGEHVLDLAVVADAGLLDGHVDAPGRLVADGSLDALLRRRPRDWAALRRRVCALLTRPAAGLGDDPALAQRALVPAGDVTLHLPFTVADYVDFYSSLEHATNVGRLLRPAQEPLLPNWRHLPVGYHGRAGTVVVSSTPVTRPWGQQRPPGAIDPVAGPTRMLDFELEVGFVTGAASGPVPVDRAEEHIFGLVLVNDWSARDVQAWEYRPLGPFLAKAFATTVSPWVVPLAALAPYRVDGPSQLPRPLDYLRALPHRNVDLRLEAALQTPWMAAAGQPAATVTRTNFRHMYWSMAQQLAHLTSGGTPLRAGDLFASGTVSGPGADAAGSLLELTGGGEHPVELPDGSRRGFLADGDRVVLRGWCGGDGGRPRVGFGAAEAAIRPARDGGTDDRKAGR